MKRLLCALALLLTVRSARADEPSQLVLEVRAQRVSHDKLANALRTELAGETDAAAGQLELSEPTEDVVRISYRDALGNTASRELKIAKDDPEALEKVTLAAANLMRDQSRALLAELEQANVKVVPKEPETEKPPPVVLEEPKKVEAPKPAYNPCRTERSLIFGGDFVPMLGTSSTRAGREATRHVSLNFFSSYSAGVRGVELSIGTNIDRRGACGVQIAPFANLTVGPVYGVQYAIGNLAWGDVRGGQVGLGNLSWGNVKGAQLGIGNFSKGDAWLQLGVTNLAIGEGAVQIGVGNIAVDGSRALQLGVINIAGGNAEEQWGVANITRGRARVQVGAFNYARSSKASIGIVSIVRDGRTSLELWTSENGTSMLGLRHGSDRVHNTFAGGFRFGPGGTRLATVFGIGVRMFNFPRHTWDFDTLFETLARTDYYELASASIRLRVVGTWKITDTYGLFAAPGYTFMSTTTEDEPSQSPFGETTFERIPIAGKASTGRTVGFPSLAIGLRIRMGGPL